MDFSSNCFSIRHFQKEEFPCQKIEFSVVNHGPVRPDLEAAIAQASFAQGFVAIDVRPLEIAEQPAKASTTQQAVDLRQRLQDDILALLAAYREATGLSPTRCDLQHADVGGIFDSPMITSVKVTVELGDIPASALVRFSEGGVIRGNGNGRPSTPKPPFRPASGSGYQPRPHGGTPIPPPNAP
jgi:hypothetical protein